MCLCETGDHGRGGGIFNSNQVPCTHAVQVKEFWATTVRGYAQCL